jgi:hypothetical protein
MGFDDRSIIIRDILGRMSESFLLIFGIALGIAAAALGMTLVAQSRINMKIALQRPDYRMINVSANIQAEESPVIHVQEQTIVLTPADLQAADDIPLVDVGFIMNTWWLKFPQANNKKDSSLEQPALEWLPAFQVSPVFFKLMDMRVSEGSLLTEADLSGGEPLILLGSEAGKKIFAPGKALNKKIQSGNMIYRISGILEPTGVERYDNAAFGLPPELEFYEQMASRLNSGKGGNYAPVNLVFGMKDSKDLIAGGVEIKKWFFREYGENSVQVTVPAEDLQRERETTMLIILIILFLALAGLFTAGVNVSNILYTRAIRRQKVVGILMALGSSRRNIFMLFYSEAMALSAAGTLLGALIAVGLLPFLGSITGQEGFNALFLVLSILSAGIIILTMTLFPALTASKLPPADAIRAD